MVVLVRHTSVDVPLGVCYGRSDVPLRSTFFEEAEVIRAGLPDFFTHVYTSPSARCVKLAEYCGYADAIRDVRLMELDFGVWEMQPWANTDLKSRWNDDWIDSPPPGGESFRQMYDRVSLFFDTLPCGEDSLIFTHGGVIRCARVYFGKTTLGAAFDEPIKVSEIVFI